jgi:dienelactone hydrolase
LLFDGVRAKEISENGVYANFLAKEETVNQAAIILIGGGSWGDYWAQELAQKGHVGLSLPYTGREDLPKLAEEVQLEYFEKAILWLAKQPQVDPGRIVVMGASRNAELSLIIASELNDLVSGAIAYAPGSVSWSNTVLPYSSAEIKPSWIYKGVAIPYIPMEKIRPSQSNIIETLSYWHDGLAKENLLQQAAIKAEKINGPILLLSGKDDRLWPSSQMADMIESRLKSKGFPHQLENIQYENAGHLISSHPEFNPENRAGSMYIDGRAFQYKHGGTLDGDRVAKIDAKLRVFAFAEAL